jgi:hypothetical protein
VEWVAVERAVSRVVTGEVNVDGWVDVIVAHREGDFVAVLPSRRDAHKDQLVSSLLGLRA